MMYHSLVPGTWNALVNKTDKNPALKSFTLLARGNGNKHKVTMRKSYGKMQGARIKPQQDGGGVFGKMGLLAVLGTDSLSSWGKSLFLAPKTWCGPSQPNSMTTS